MSTTGERPRPRIDRDSAPWWAAIERHRVELQRCSSCRTWRWPPRAMCPRCGSFEAGWEQTGQRGTIASWIVSHHRFGPWLPVPYIVALVRLDEQDDLFVPGSYVGDVSELAVGAPVEAVFVDLDGVVPDHASTVLSWQLAADQER